MEKEKEVFGEIQKEFQVTARDKFGRPITFARIQNDLARFNAIHENEGENPNFSSKLGVLRALLLSYGFNDLPGYSVHDACENRIVKLQGLKQIDYPGTILDTPQSCRTDRPQ